MDIRDLNAATAVSVALNSVAVSTNTTTNGAVVDLQDANSVLFAISASGYVNGSFAVSIQEGNAADLSDATTVAADRIQGTLPTIAANGAFKVGARRSQKRYMRISIVSTATTTGATLSAVALASDLRTQAAV